MCGIATISIGRRSRGRIPYELLRELVRELLYELQPRGTDASGIAIINEPNSGVNSVVFKKPLRPHRFVVRPKFNEVLEHIGPQTNFILLHARASSVGDTSDDFNNHPIVTPPILGIHNGTLYNDDSIFKKFSDDFDREGEVDSEVIFRLYNYFTESGGLSPKQAMQATSDQLWGSYTGAIIDMRHSHRMVMFKFQRSLVVFRLKHYDIIIAISEAKFYDDAARRLGINSRVDCKYVTEGTGLLIDLNIPSRITDSIIDFNIPVDGSLNSMRSYAPWFASGYCGY